MCRVRTINQFYEELKKNDPENGLSKHAIRMLVNDGTIPSLKMGSRYYIEYDAAIKAINRALGN